MARKKKRSGGFLKKLIITIFICAIAFGGYKIYSLYQGIKSPNVNLDGKREVYIKIPTGANYHDVTNILYENNYIVDRAAFEWVAEKKNYHNHVKPGRYKIAQGMSNNQLVNLLRSGRQVPVRLVFNKVRTKERFAGIIAEQIEADSLTILRLLNNERFLKTYNFNKYTAMCMFIPNTYEFYWNTSAKAFIERMYNEYERFWTDERLRKAEQLKLSQCEVIIMASIVEEETTKNSEKSRVAGVYYNRLQKRMRLQADPTVKFAVGDFTIKRILNKHLQYQSPYNTYRNAGLPPGPICLPSITTITAVLNLEHHQYLYFCAKEDFSGFHVFAKTLRQHNLNAAKYRQALNRERIYR